MELKRENVVERIKEAREYGLNYAKLARAVEIQPVSIYMFINGTYNMAIEKQLKILCYIENYIEEIKKQFRKIEHRGLCVR